MISVILCMYNGERYIEKQLESIFQQTLKPDVVEIFDDCSTDRSSEIVKEFISKNQLDNWTITKNQTNKGWRLNFYDAIIKHQNDDIIFFSDHDDIWNSEKIEIMSNIMLNNPNILRLSGEQVVIDQDDNLIETKYIKTCPKNYKLKVRKESAKLNMPSRTWQFRLGCAMCISGKLAKTLADFGFNDQFSHDNWAAFVSSLCDGGYTVEFPSIKYRVHASNTSNPDAKTTMNIFGIQARINTLKNDYRLMSIYKDSIARSVVVKDKRTYRQFVEKMDFSLRRIKNLEDKKYFLMFCSVFSYIFKGEFRAYIGDMLTIIKDRKGK